MKTRLLVGLVAVALGGLTSCSNILEENGVINNVAESGKGYLRISLDQNNVIEVNTKTISFDGAKLTIPEEDMKNFNIKATRKGEDSPIEGLTGPYKDVKGSQVAVDPGTYTLSASYSSMSDNFEFDNPCFSGSDEVSVTAGDLTTGRVECALSNSIIQFPNLSTFADKVTIDKLVAITGEVDDQAITNAADLSENIKTKTLYVKPNLEGAKIVMKGKLKTDNTPFTAVANIGGNSQTSAQKVYNISYSLNSSQGSLTIEITVSDSVNPNPITITIDPYNNNNNTQS